MLVTAIMPTRGRQQWAKQALESFLNQSYQNKRIIILDDEDDPSFPDGVFGEQLLYFQDRVRYNIPQKLNKGCEFDKAADIIVKWDSDDWYASTRIADQVRRLQRVGKAVTTYYEILFHQSGTDKAFRYTINANWGTGTSLAFLRSYWMNNRFSESKPVGSDNHFMKAARDQSQLDSTKDTHKTIVARIHSDNTSFKRCTQTASLYYKPISVDQLPDDYLMLERVTA